MSISFSTYTMKPLTIPETISQSSAHIPYISNTTLIEDSRLLKDFKDINIEQTHIFPYKVEKYKNYIYEKKDYFQVMPKELFKCLEKNLGWHLCITCRK